MGVVKKLLRPRVIVWAATTVVLTALMVTATVLTTSTYKGLLEGVFGSDVAIKAEGDNGIIFEQKFTTKDEARENANEVVKEICEEGMVLLKNENNCLPLKQNARVSVFGKNSIQLVYGGSGSAAPGGDIPKKTIYDSLNEAGFSCNPDLKEFYEDNKRSGDGRGETPDLPTGGVASLPIGETPIDKYKSDVTSSYSDYSDAAIMVVSRIAGENWDLPRVQQGDTSRHYLELDNNERNLLKHIVDSNEFDHIILLVNTSNYVDLGFLKITSDPAYFQFGNKIDGCIVVGSPGGNGIMALGNILNGSVNPSGHTVDTLYTNYENDPTWENFGDGKPDGIPYGGSYRKAPSGYADFYGVEYEENIYLGYRYYETRGHEKGEDWYNANVVYPFGYGLSYTTFSQEITNKSALGGALNPDETFDVEIKVTNTGSVAGKQVVQLYAEAPYEAGKIEKAYKVLVGFNKTQLLEPGKSETVKITVNPYDFASFDSRDKNGNGEKTWELDAGTYKFHAGTDAHTDFDVFEKSLANIALFKQGAETEVKPLFPELTTWMDRGQNLSRADFAQDNPASFPVAPTVEELTLTAEQIAKFKSTDSTNDEVYNEMPTTNAPITVQLKELAGKEYDDELWDKFLDQLTPDEMLTLFNDGCYSTQKILRGSDVLVPATTSADGPTGFVAFLGNPAVYGCCYYQSEVLLAQTFNLDLATKQAHAIGEESLVGNEGGDGMPYPGWYAPAMNIHRSPFSGRNTEYYSEDPFISGKFAAQVVKGVQEKGVYANIKHFAVNDQETNRSANGLATWLDEQAMREIYLKPFEIAVKEGKSHGLMTSFNRLGYEWAGGSYRLVTTILRKEWGFQGSVICDFKTDAYMDSKQMLYAGGDIGLIGDKKLKLQTSGIYNTPFISFDDAKDVSLLRRSAHNNLYAIANSNMMKADIIGYKPAAWKVLVYVADGAVGAGLLTWGFFAIFTSLRRKEEVAAAAAE